MLGYLLVLANSHELLLSSFALLGLPLIEAAQVTWRGPTQAFQSAASLSSLLSQISSLKTQATSAMGVTTTYSRHGAEALSCATLEFSIHRLQEHNKYGTVF